MPLFIKTEHVEFSDKLMMVFGQRARETAQYLCDPGRSPIMLRLDRKPQHNEEQNSGLEWISQGIIIINKENAKTWAHKDMCHGVEGEEGEEEEGRVRSLLYSPHPHLHTGALHLGTGS